MMRTIAIADMSGAAALAFLQKLGIYQAAQRENRRRIRVAKRTNKQANYFKNGLNGPRAMARRARQWDAIEARKAREAAEALRFSEEFASRFTSSFYSQWARG